MALLARVKGEVIIVCLGSPGLGESPFVCFSTDQEWNPVCFVPFKLGYRRAEASRLRVAFEKGVGSRSVRMQGMWGWD